MPKKNISKKKKIDKKPKKEKKPRKRFALFPAFCDKLLILITIALIIFSSFMIASAAMGEGAGDQSVIMRAITRQVVFFVIGIVFMIAVSRHNLLEIPLKYFDIGYVIVLAVLLSTRIFGETYGAYAWIRLGPLSVQPSEFAKVYMILYISKVMSKDHGERNEIIFRNVSLKAGLYAGIILAWQKDLGSAVVLAGICYVMLLITPQRELIKIHKYMLGIIGLMILGIGLSMVPAFNEFLSEHFSGNYKIGRFLAAYNPFAYQYSTGYHLIMGLVSFATGGWFGLGYGNSIHKYMNFPNPTTDFILPVIVEELGVIWGLLPILIAYGIIFIKLIYYSTRMKRMSSKLVLTGTFTYLFIHFVLNIGGVSGLIPLTGVPLLLVSSGGSSLLATMISIGICEAEIIEYQKEIKENENYSG